MRTNSPHPLYEEMAVFARVVEMGSFSRVARELGATPSSISRNITRLEKQLGLRLLQRTTRKLGLTENGHSVLQACKDLVAAAKTVMDTGSIQTKEPQGQLRICVPKAIGRSLIHPHIASFLQTYPAINLQMILEDRVVDIVERNIDLALRVTESPPVGLIGRRLVPIEHLICASPHYLTAHTTPITPLDLINHSCICLGEDPSDARWKFTKNGMRSTVTVKGRYAANNTGVRRNAALEGLGIASLPRFTAKDDIESGRLVQLLPEWQFTTRYSGMLWLLYSPTRYMPIKLRVFIDHLVKHLSATE